MSHAFDWRFVRARELFSNDDNSNRMLNKYTVVIATRFIDQEHSRSTGNATNCSRISTDNIGPRYFMFVVGIGETCGFAQWDGCGAIERRNKSIGAIGALM